MTTSEHLGSVTRSTNLDRRSASNPAQRRIVQSPSLALRLYAAMCAALLGSLAPGYANAEDAAHITPYRPTISNSAQLPTPGQVELELGLLATRNDANRRSLPYLLKLAFNPDWGVLIGGEAYVSQRTDDGGSLSGIGNTVVTAKRAWIINDARAWGLEFSASLPSAKTEIGGGKTDLGVNGILSQDLGSLHLDTNLNLTRIGAIEADTGRIQTGLSAALTLPLVPRWSLAAELAATRRNGTDGTAQALTALTYSPSKTLTIDAGVSKGLRAGARDWSFFTGLVVPIGTLW